MWLSIKVKSVKPLENLWIAVIFENGIEKIYDVKQLFNNFEIYKELEKEELFKLVKVDCGGYAISWNDEIDISEVELWENGVEKNKGAI